MTDTATAATRPPWTATPEEVAAFVQEHGRPYDSTSDDYADPGPFSHAVKEGRKGEIYNAHSYHTKVPPEGIVPYLEHYTRPGDLVLDPFCGSGMTGVASLMTGRNAILNDLSPAATHIAYNYCTPLDTAALRREFERIKEAVRDEFDWLYGTTCDKGHHAVIQYTIWSDVFRCRSCRGEIVLWDAAVDHAKGVVSQKFRCPGCGGGPWSKTDLDLVRSEPVEAVLECRGTCRTSRGKPKRYRRRPTTRDVSRLAEIERAEIPYWYPTNPFSNDREMWRGGHRDRGVFRICDFWTRRNLRAVARIWLEIQGAQAERYLRAMRFLLTSVILGHTSKLSRVIFKDSGTPILTSNQTGTLYVPSFSVEKNVIEAVSRKYDDVCVGLTTALSSHARATVINGPAQGIPASDRSVDYIFTDPPFGSNIFYADCSLLWESWLGYFTDERYEAVWNKSKKPAEGGKTLDDYERLMAEAFAEMYRVLKPGRWASVVFHNSDDRVWQAIQRGAVAAGFEIAGAQQFDKVQLSFKGIKGQKGRENVTNKDVVLNLQKPLRRGRTSLELAPDAEEIVSEAIVEHLRNQPPPDERGLQALQGLAIRALINRGYQVEVSWRSVETAIKYIGCKQVDGAWYLPGEDVPGTALDVRDEASAISWVRQVIAQEGPQTRGELTPRFQQVSIGADLRKPLADLLAENFVLEERTNLWRLPTREERERLNDFHALARRREIGRILEGRAARPYSDSELADLAVSAYTMGLYAAVMRIAPMIRSDTLSAEKRATIDQIQTVAGMKLEMTEPVLTQGQLL